MNGQWFKNNGATMFKKFFSKKKRQGEFFPKNCSSDYREDTLRLKTSIKKKDLEKPVRDPNYMLPPEREEIVKKIDKDFGYVLINFDLEGQIQFLSGVLAAYGIDGDSLKETLIVEVLDYRGETLDYRFY